MTDELELRRLNEEYIQAFMTSDTAWYERRLSDDFICIESDGSVLDKAAFLAQTAKGTDITEYHLRDVSVRRFGEVALVQATGDWRSSDGHPGISRYTDIYVRANGDWQVVSAQITRPPTSATASQTSS